MNESTRKNINIVIPAVVAGYIGYRSYQQQKDWRKPAIITAVSFLIIYAIVASITGGIKRAKDTEIINNTPPDPNYNPAPLANALFQDIYEIFGFRDKQYYKDLAALTDAQFISVCKYWNDNYYFKDKETLKQAINGEVLGIELSGTLETINVRFQNLKIN